MFTKPVSELTRDDLNLVLGVSEGDRLEFKREAYGRADDDIREFLKDISSMANAVGGFLLIGVAANSEERATALPGIENADDEATRMLSSCRANLEEQILGLDFGLIEMAPGRHILIWGIPRSSRAPHMITFKGLNQFWRRHGRQKARMTIEEIRDACLRVENLRSRLETFLDERHKSQLAAVGNQEGVMLLSATPLIVRDEVLDTADSALRTLMRNPPDTDVRPTLYGLQADNRDGRVEVFRNGHIEVGVDISRSGGQPNTLNPWTIAQTTLHFLMFVQSVFNHVGLQEPVVVAVTLAGIPAWEMDQGVYRKRGKWEARRNLEVQPMQFAYPLTPGPAAKRIADRVWNALGLDACPLFDEQGTFNPGGIQRW